MAKSPIRRSVQGQAPTPPMELPPRPKPKGQGTNGNGAGSVKDIPAPSLLKQVPDPTPGLGGTLSFFFGGTGEERKEFKFRTPRAAGTRPWRQAVAGPAEAIFVGVLGMMGKDLQDPQELVGLADFITKQVLTVPDLIADFVLDFSPELREKEGEIMDLAFDEELAQAFITCCKVAFPLASLQSLLTVGEQMSGISSNSASPNGESGPKS